MAKNREKRIFYEWLNDNHGYFYTINRTLQKTESEFQEVELVETDEMGNVLLLDSITQTAQNVEWQYHEPMVHFPMLSHPQPRRVLVIGGGDGGILREVLRHPSVEHVDFAELDRDVVEFSRQYLPDVNHGAFDDKRVNIHITDGRAFVEQSETVWDVAIMDMTDPFGPSRMLYTREFYRLVRDALRSEEGLFAMHAESPVARPVAHRCIEQTLAAEFAVTQTVYTFIQMYATYWSFAIASPGTSIAEVSGELAERRCAERGISGLQMINAATWESMQVAFPYIDGLPTDVPVITDDRPVFPDHFSASGGTVGPHTSNSTTSP